MSLSFLTKHSRLPSTRLKSLAGYLQLSAVLTAIAMVGVAVWRIVADDSDFKLPLPLPVLLLYGALSAISLHLIARGLLQRQRWAGYLAAFTFGAPVIKKLFTSGSEVALGVTILPLIALITIASVWNELGTVRESEGYGTDDDGVELPKRNRGFGERRNATAERTDRPMGLPETLVPLPATNRGYREPRTLSLETMPATTTAAANTPLPINKPRAH